MSAVAHKLPVEPQFTAGSEIIRISYGSARLELTIRGVGGGSVRVSFEDVAGFRVLDERDLLDFWPTCSTPNGWLFEIASGGWLDQESQREGFMMRAMNENVREFFVTGEDDCVNVLARAQPEVDFLAEGGPRREL
jgi:hypothetical protein